MRAATARWSTVLAATLAMAGCGGEDPASDRPVPPATAGLSPQRVLARPTLARTVVARGFGRVVGLVQEPGARGRILVLEQDGLVRRLDADRPAAGPPFLDLRGRISTKDEQGVLGLVLVPGANAAGGDRVVVHQSDPDGASRVVRYRVRDGRVDLASGRSLLRVERPYANHNGGEPVLGPDGRLYVGMGDGGSAFDPRQRAQDRTSPLGKLLSTDPRAATPRWRQVALGLRNPWRLHFDPGTGALWVADAGRDSAEAQTEEIDRIPAGFLRAGRPVNFGWAAFEGARSQSNRRLAHGTELLWPVASYTRRDGCNAVGGPVVPAGSGPAALRDRYVFGDTCSGIVWSIPAAAPQGVELRREGVLVPRQTAYLLDRRGRLLVGASDGTISRLRDARDVP